MRCLPQLGHLANVFSSLASRFPVDLELRWIFAVSAWNDRSRGGQPAQPRILPEDLALRFATIVLRAGASNVGQRHRIVYAPQPGLVAHVVDLVDTPMHPKDLAAKGLHFGHERQAIERSGRVERRLDLVS